MIDIEATVFEAVKTGVAPAKCTPTYQDINKVFPLVTVEEIDNSSYERTQDSASGENHVRLLYEINVYSNSVNGKKEQAKQLIEKADTVMAKLGFYRTYCSPTPNLADLNIYRITARYRAVVDKDQNIYWR